MLKKNSGLLTMIFSILGIVVWVSIFEQVMAFFDALFLIAGIEDLLLLTLILNFAPTILLLGGIATASLGYVKGYKNVAVKDSNGLIRMVIAALGLVLFVAMFNNIATVFVDLFALYDGDPNYPIFSLALSITPAILFLGGVTAMIGTGIAGYKAGQANKANKA